MMSFKLSFILLCGLSVHVIHAQPSSFSQLINEAAAESNGDFLVVLNSGKKALMSLAEEYTEPIWNSVTRTWRHKHGSESIKKIVTEVKHIMQDPTASKTLLNIASALHECFVYTPEDRKLVFPWKNFIQLLETNGIHVFPMLYHGMWKLGVDKKTGSKLDKIVKVLNEMFRSSERNEKISDMHDDPMVKARMDEIISQINDENLQDTPVLQARYYWDTAFNANSEGQAAVEVRQIDGVDNPRKGHYDDDENGDEWMYKRRR